MLICITSTRRRSNATNLIAVGIATAAAQLGSPTLESGQLSSAGIATAAAFIGSPVFSLGAGEFNADGIATAAAFIGSPVIGQIHGLGADGIATAAAALGSPAFTSSGPIEVFDIGHATANALTTTITVPSGGVPAGSLIVVGVCTEWGNGLSSITDSASNTYVRAKFSGSDLVAAPYVDVWYCKNCNALSSGNTIVTHMSNGFRQRSSAFYATNVHLTAPLDQIPTSTHANSSTPSITSGTLAAGSELVVGWLGLTTAATVTMDANFTSPPPDTEASAGTMAIYGGYRIMSAGDQSAQTFAPTFAGGAQVWTEELTSFKHA